MRNIWNWSNYGHPLLCCLTCTVHGALPHHGVEVVTLLQDHLHHVPLADKGEEDPDTLDTEKMLKGVAMGIMGGLRQEFKISNAVEPRYCGNKI